MTQTTPMIRPFWTEPARPDLDDITVLICQNKTPDLIRLSLTSLLTFYPTIKILIVNGTPDDEAGKWIKYKAAKHPNVTVWDRVGYDSHGVAMDDAIREKITTRYILTLDSDVIIKRGGWIEEMKRFFHMAQYAMPDTLFAVGALMEVSRKGDACGEPENADDILRYIHPHCGMYDRNIYIELEASFTDHGAPCVYTMKKAEELGFKVEGFPVADYIMHLSGASWTDPRTVWSYDNEVMVRPLVTFVENFNEDLVRHPIGGALPRKYRDADNDFEIVYAGEYRNDGYYIVHGKEKIMIPHSNNLFHERLRVRGDYVCVLKQHSFYVGRGALTNYGNGLYCFLLSSRVDPATFNPAEEGRSIVFVQNRESIIFKIAKVENDKVWIQQQDMDQKFVVADIESGTTMNNLGKPICNAYGTATPVTIEKLRAAATLHPEAEEIVIDGLTFYSRKHYQEVIAWQ